MRYCNEDGPAYVMMKNGWEASSETRVAGRQECAEQGTIGLSRPTAGLFTTGDERLTRGP